MRVRRLEAADCVPFMEAFATVAAEGEWILTEPPIDVPARAERLRELDASGRGVFWVLEDDGGTIAGGIGLQRTGEQGVMDLGMHIRRDQRGRGGGRLLLDAALAYARDAGLERVDLEVFPENERALRLYRSRGFVAGELLRDHYPRRDGSVRSALPMSWRP